MDAVVKIVAGATILWLLLGAKGVLEKKQRVLEEQRQTEREKADAARDSLVTVNVSSEAPPAAAIDRTRIGYEIESTGFLQDLSKYTIKLDTVQVTYHLIAKSVRCAYDSLPPCLQEKISAAGIDAREFQYAYFLDRVLEMGTGILRWNEREYVVRYDDLLEAGWSRPDGDNANSYDCDSFAYRNKNGMPFIAAAIEDSSLFQPIETAPFPNGPTVSEQQAIDWLTVTVNTRHIPLSVPEPQRRDYLAKRMEGLQKRRPEPRVYLVLEFPNGKRFLTEPSDANDRLPPDMVNLLIGNTAAEIEHFRSLPKRANAVCFIIDDENMTYDRILARSVN